MSPLARALLFAAGVTILVAIIFNPEVVNFILNNDKAVSHIPQTIIINKEVHDTVYLQPGSKVAMSKDSIVKIKEENARLKKDIKEMSDNFMKVAGEANQEVMDCIVLKEDFKKLVHLTDSLYSKNPCWLVQQ